jgi:hypothetical protein
MKLLSGEEAAQAVVSLSHRYASFDPEVEKTVAGIVKQVRSESSTAWLREHPCGSPPKSCKRHWAW